MEKARFYGYCFDEARARYGGHTGLENMEAAENYVSENKDKHPKVIVTDRYDRLVLMAVGGVVTRHPQDDDVA